MDDDKDFEPHPQWRFRPFGPEYKMNLEAEQKSQGKKKKEKPEADK